VEFVIGVGKRLDPDGGKPAVSHYGRRQPKG
jgi:hypothetical protein